MSRPTPAFDRTSLDVVDISNSVDERDTRRASARMLAAGVTLLMVLILAARDVTAVTLWLYPLAWGPLLVLLDAWVARRDGESLLDRPRQLVSLLWWSAVIWFVFEALNVRLANWYYVNVPAVRWQRWIGTLLAFATVLPAILLPARLLEQRGFAARWVMRPVAVGRRDLALAFVTGVAMLAAVLAWPQRFYPLIWGAVWLIAEPPLYQGDRAHSLFADLERGRWGRIVRIMTAGLIAGAFWESLNALARTRWIYTVPFLEQLKLFEMPPLGFIGFPFFALEAWSLYHLLRRWTRWWSVAVSMVAVVGTLRAMDRATYASTVPWSRDLPGVSPRVATALEHVGLVDAFRLERAPAESLIHAGLSPDEAVRLRELARVAALRGIGPGNAAALSAAGYTTLERLAAADPAAVWMAVRRDGSRHPSAAEVRVWVRGAAAVLRRNS
jgi:hypothetical protein